MNAGSHHQALQDDLDAAGFTPAERAMLWAAIDKPGTELTEAERGLLLRYEAVAQFGNAA